MHRRSRRLTALTLAGVLCAACCGYTGRIAPESPALTASASAYIPGIDVSKYQEKIDWETAAAYGEKFAIIRCCKIYHAYGDREFDERFLENYEGARAAGLAVGCYLFTDAATSAEFKSDVEFLLEHIEGLSFDFPVYLDIESKTRQEHLAASVFTPPLLEALEMIEQAGHTAGVYANTAFFSECIDRAQINEHGYEVWEANYFDTSTGLSSPAGHNLSETANIWQYTGSGRTGGVKTPVDRNICYSYHFFDHTVTIEDAVLPEEILRPNTSFRIDGTVTGQAVIRTLNGTILNAETEEPVQNVTVYPHAKSYNLAGFFSKKLNFGSLQEGSYVLHITAVDSSGKTLTAAETPFEIVAETTTTTTAYDPLRDGSSSLAEAVRQAKSGEYRDTTETRSGMTDTTTTTARRVTTEAPETGGSFLRTMLRMYEDLGIRDTLNAMKETSTSLALERTPLHRIISSASDRADALYTAAGLLTGDYT